MLVPKGILFWAATSIALSTTAVSARTAPYPTVFGYRSAQNKVVLTQDGHTQFQTQRLSSPQQKTLQNDVRYLAQTLNQLRDTQTFDAKKITPVISHQDKRLQYEIWHAETPLLRVGSVWKKAGESQLNCMIRLTNALRSQTGAAKITLAQVRSKVSHQQGQASWYGGFFHGRLTANGERYDVNKLTAAHKKLPFGTRVLVTNVATQKSVVVKINDRGPFVSERIIDLSPEAFKRIGHLGQGVMSVKLTILNDNA